MDRCLTGDDRSLGLSGAVRRIVFAVTQAEGTCRQHHGRRVEQIIDAMR